MMFEKNLAVLRRMDPLLATAVERSEKGGHLEILRSRTGMPVLRAERILLHSLYDPVREARQWYQYHRVQIKSASSLCVFGFAMGYHLIELCKHTDKKIIIFEPRIDVLKKAMQTICLTAVLSKVRIITDSAFPSDPEMPTILPHKPSMTLNGQYFSRISAEMRGRDAVSRGLKILVVGPVYGGSLPAARYCSMALKELGHEVEFLDNSRFADNLYFAREIASNNERYASLVSSLSAFLSEALVARCESFEPDLVFALAQAPLTVDCLQILKAGGITTACWFVEDFRVMEYWKEIACHYDHFFTIQKGSFHDELRSHGARNIAYLPSAACPEIHRKIDVSEEEKKYYGSDLSFFGAGYYNRRHFFTGLLDFDFKIWGSDWAAAGSLSRCIQRSGKRIDMDEAVRIFSSSRINLNLHSSTYHRGINPAGDYVNPRTFEIASCGEFQLVDSRTHLDELFSVGEEIIVFRSLDDLKEKILYYLDRPDERERIAGRGQARVLRDHTYKKRMEDMLTVLMRAGFSPRRREERGEEVTKLVAAAGNDRELSDYLSRFSERERISLPEIVEAIRQGEGEISRPETLFLLLNELTA